MPRDPYLDALAAEIDQTIMAAQSARRILDEWERGERAARKARSRAGQGDLDPGTTRSLRYTGMTVSEAASVLGVTLERVRVMLRKNELVGVEFGGRIGWRLSREHVHEVAAQWEVQRRGQRAAARQRSRRPASSGPSR